MQATTFFISLNCCSLFPHSKLKEMYLYGSELFIILATVSIYCTTVTVTFPVLK